MAVIVRAGVLLALLLALLTGCQNLAPAPAGPAAEVATVAPVRATSVAIAEGVEVALTGVFPSGSSLVVCGVTLQSVQFSEAGRQLGAPGVSGPSGSFGRATGVLQAAGLADQICSVAVVVGGVTVASRASSFFVGLETGLLDAPFDVSAFAGSGEIVLTFVIEEAEGLPFSSFEYSLDDGASWATAEVLSVDDVQDESAATEEPEIDDPEAWITSTLLQPQASVHAASLSRLRFVKVRIPNLTNNTAYSILLRGLNAIGIGRSSSAVAATPGPSGTLELTVNGVFAGPLPAHGVKVELCRGSTSRYLNEGTLLDCFAEQTASGTDKTVTFTGLAAGTYFYRVTTQPPPTPAAPFRLELWGYSSASVSNNATTTASFTRNAPYFNGGAITNATSGSVLGHCTIDFRVNWNSSPRSVALSVLISQSDVVTEVDLNVLPSAQGRTANALLNSDLNTTGPVQQFVFLKDRLTGMAVDQDGSWRDCVLTPPALSITDGDNQSAVLNSNVSVQPRVLVTMHDRPVAGLVVSFSVPTGTGGLAGTPSGWPNAERTSLATDVNGRATLGIWRLLGSSVGARTLTASIGGVSETFNATAITIGASAPTITSVTPGSGRVLVTFSVGDDGGTAITDYEYQVVSGGDWASAGTTTSPLLIPNLTNNTSYSVAIRAVNALGGGDASNRMTSTPLASLACNFVGGLCIVRDTGPGGGVVFYVHPENATFKCGPSRVADCRYLEVAPTNWQQHESVGISTSGDPARAWSGSPTDAVPAPGAWRFEIGDGYQNTLAAIAQSDVADRAVSLTRAYQPVVDGTTWSDWYLPSFYELNELCKYASNTGQVAGRSHCEGGSGPTDGFASAHYWTSSEVNPLKAYSRRFSASGSVSFIAAPDKGTARHVRPIRAF